MFPRVLFTPLLLSLIPGALAAQAMPDMHPRLWYGLLEIPLLVIAVVFGFLTARALHGGRLGAGMILIAWGFLAMAIGHLHMQVDAFFGINTFALLFGPTGGSIVWVAALALTWTLTALGFFRLYRASHRI